LFYPEWVSGREGCRNDGDEPDHMAANPVEWLSSTMEACCKKFFGGYNYDKCIGRYPPQNDDCTVKLYYPDWNGANEGCADDGQEPLYMLSNAKLFLFNTREECCKKFFGWNYYVCTGTLPELPTGMFYPNWSGTSSTTCLNDNKMPTYMLRNQQYYFFSSLRQCCEKHFSWDIQKCMGTDATGTGKWYVKWGTTDTCVQDCIGASNPNCGGIAKKWDETFSDKNTCCEKKMWWDKEGCRSRSA
jgi:hypothetical protein